MGEEIQYSRFNKTDYQQFSSHLDKETAYMFLGFDRLDYYGDPSGRLLCHMTLQTDLSDTGLAVGNYRLWDENKKLVAEAKGVHLKQAPLDTFLNSLGKREDTPLYKLQWQLSGLNGAGGNSSNTPFRICL